MLSFLRVCTMSFENLPYEVLEEIFRYLGVSDRLAAILVCSHWYRASLNRNAWKDAVIYVDSSDRANEIVNMITECERIFPNLVFNETNNFRNSSKFFDLALQMCQIVGPQLCILQFNRCSITGHTFTHILVQCPNLTDLGVVDCENVFSYPGGFLDGIEENTLKSMLQKIKYLDLSFNRNLTDFHFMRIAQIFTNVKCLSLESCPINFRNIVFKRFYPPKVKAYSNQILNFHFILEYISNNATKLTSLNFNSTDIDHASLCALAQVKGLALENIFLLHCLLIRANSLKQLCSCQRNLKGILFPSIVKFSEVFPSMCSYLRELREIDVTSMWSPDETHTFFDLERANFSKLISLKLRCCKNVLLKFTDSICSEAYPRLKHLSLLDSRVDEDCFIKTIPYLFNITYLDLRSSKVTDKSLTLISLHLVLLQVLNLNHCENITNEGLMGRCGQMENISRLEIQRHINKEELENNTLSELWAFNHSVPISNLVGLRELNLYSTNIGDEGLKAALVFRELKFLCLGGSSKVTDEGIEAVGKNNRSLEVLSLRNSIDVTENGIEKILHYLPRLRILELQGCTKLTNSGLQDIVKNNLKLKYIL